MTNDHRSRIEALERAVFTTPTVVVPSPIVEPTPQPVLPCGMTLPRGELDPFLPFTNYGFFDMHECNYRDDLDGRAKEGFRDYVTAEFRVTNPKVSAWTVTLSSSDVDTYLFLSEYDESAHDYTPLRENDHIGSGNTDSQITWIPTDGQDYALIMTTYYAEQFGSYPVRFESAVPEDGSMIEFNVRALEVETDAINQALRALSSKPDRK